MNQFPMKSQYTYRSMHIQAAYYKVYNLIFSGRIQCQGQLLFIGQLAQSAAGTHAKK